MLKIKDNVDLKNVLFRIYREVEKTIPECEERLFILCKKYKERILMGK